MVDYINKMLKKVLFGLFYIIKKAYLCAMFLQRVHIAPSQQQQRRVSQQPMAEGVRVQ